jgi:hypothetical protein
VTLEHALTVFFTWFLYLNVALLIGAILLANHYAFLHAWRSERSLWFVVLVALFLAGGGIATPVYLILFHDEPMPGRGSEFWRRVLA